MILYNDLHINKIKNAITSPTDQMFHIKTAYSTPPQQRAGPYLYLFTIISLHKNVTLKVSGAFYGKC